MTLQELFKIGMKREIPELLPIDSPAVNLGAGAQQMPYTMNLDYPDWNGEEDTIPMEENSVGTVFAFHFLEHLPGESVISMLREVERVLKPGGTMLIVVPHAASSMAFHDLDHKSFFNEDTFPNLFDTRYYTKHREDPWQLKIHLNIVMAVAFRNLAVLTQLVKL